MSFIKIDKNRKIEKIEKIDGWTEMNIEYILVTWVYWPDWFCFRDVEVILGVGVPALGHHKLIIITGIYIYYKRYISPHPQ